MSLEEIQKLEKEMYANYEKLVKLRRDTPLTEVSNYEFKTEAGTIDLLSMFGNKETLFVIHNMGQTCPYCTLWADGLNSFLPHLENQFSIYLVSKDDPETQRKMANDRGWRYKMASHGGGSYITEQSVAPSDNPAAGNYPGLVCYEKKGGKIYRKNRTVFGPGDEFCSVWNILSLAGLDESHWNPQFEYMSYPNSEN